MKLGLTGRVRDDIFRNRLVLERTYLANRNEKTRIIKSVGLEESRFVDIDEETSNSRENLKIETSVER